MAQSEKKLSLHEIIVKVTNMVSYDSNASILAKKAGLAINYLSWEDCARDKGSCWGPCISDMSLCVNNSCMPVIRKPNYSDVTWDVKMSSVPIVIGNQSSDVKTTQQTISLTDYLCNFSDFMSNDYYKTSNKQIDLTSQKENKDSHVIMTSQACFLPIEAGEETKFNIALFNYQSKPRNPSCLVIVSTSKGSSAQIIEGKEQHLLFNKNGKKADFIGERVSDVRHKKGQKKNLKSKKLSKAEKLDNVIVIVQVPLKQKAKPVPYTNLQQMLGGYAVKKQKKLQCRGISLESAEDEDESKVNVEAAMVKISERTKPVCKCNKELEKYQVQYAYNGTGIRCDECGVLVSGKEELIYHCADKKSYKHENGYDLCIACGEKQLKYDELRGMLEADKDYVLERDEKYPVRVTLQYFKATDNGAMNQEIMDEIVKQLAVSQKQADFMGSLVTEYNKERPSEWVSDKDEVKGNDEYQAIRKALEEMGGNDWTIYLKKFEDEEVKDTDLENITDDDLKELIPKIGPRNRFKKWIKSIK
eukprot:224657_1